MMGEDEGCGCGCDCGDIDENKMCVVCSPAMNFDMERVKKLSSDPKFVCRCCGRTANESENLCSPVDLK
jgi:hypothetical protein